jgi:hypothetical protein
MEQWKDITGYEGSYQVSSTGRVRSLDRVTCSDTRGPQTLKGRVLKPGIASNGYYTVALRKDGNTRTRTVHDLVADAFVGVRPKGLVIDHIDGDRLNNLPINLRYVPQAVNGQNVTKANSASGKVGVYRNGSGWMAQVKVRGVGLHLGTFGTIEEAATARAAWERENNYAGY